MEPPVLPSAEEAAALYRELSQNPGISTACLGPDVTTQYGGKYCSLYTEWSQRDLVQAKSIKFCRQYLLFHDGASIVYAGPGGACCEINNELLSCESPSGAMKAVLLKVAGKEKEKEKEKQFLEVWYQNRKVKSIDLTALDKHGSVYDDNQFGCLAWSHSETHLLYVAEKKRPKAESFFQTKAPELDCSADEELECPKKPDAPIKGEQFVYHEDWGETLSTRSVPVLCVLDIEGSSISVLEGVPKHVSPGQAFWSPDDTGVVFVGRWHEPFRLGLRHCNNRRSALFYVDLTGGKCELLSEDTGALWSPRLSPDRCHIAYLENRVLGPHQQCSRLRMYNWHTKQTRTVLEVVPRQVWGAFPGIYCSALPRLCWAADSRRLVLDTSQRSQQDVFVVDMQTGSTTSLTADAPQGSWSVLTIDRDLLVAQFSTPSCPATLQVAVLPGVGQEAQIKWICLQNAPPVPGISWGIRTLKPPPEQENPQYEGLDFDAILLRPSEGPTAQKPPLVVMPHGGPHTVFSAGWMLYPATLCRLGFAVLLVNYRGSLGFGQDSVNSLPGNVGTQDVRDVQLCVERVLQEEQLDASRVALVGGSHGGFLACHLIGQFPDTYRACVVRNPVVNIASMLTITDIPDWCLTEVGVPYEPNALPDPAHLTVMLQKSPMSYINQVRTPVLLMLGEDDKRVPPAQGLEYYRALKARGVPTRLLGQDSPSGQRRAVLVRCPLRGHELLEVWDGSGRSHSVDLTALGKHGAVYTEGPFACLAWSHLETQLLYVAEKSRPTLPAACPGHVPEAARPAEDEDEEGERFVYHEGWGERLNTRSAPMLCMLDIKSSSVSVLESVPEHVSPGQALWSPGDTGLVFVGWWHEPFRLGLSACSNRRSGIFHLELASGHCELLSAPNRASFSPRLSPDGQHLLYLEGAVGGPHRQCLQLRLLTWQMRQTVTVLDVVQEPTGSESSFTGIYTDALPPQCWAADSRRALLCTPQRSRTDLLLVDTETATVTNLTAGSPEGCWELLTIQWDLLVATCSAPHRPPSLVMAELPPLGQELPLRWVPVEDTPPVPGITWKTLTVQQNSSPHNPQPFEALLLSPTGGPHAVFDARWRPSMAALCWLGFTVLLVNYRGSLGFGQASIECLQSRVGEQDVADTQLAVEQALRYESLDPHRVALLAGSHGAFIALHLLTRQPERYQACALRNPVSNLPALLGTSDIPDWRYTSLGLPYSFQRVPRVEDLVVMLQRSPIIQAPRVRAPVLLCVGARDRRVSPTQALELYRVLRAHRVPTRLLWYPEGGHALTGVEMEADVFGNCARWFLQHLGRPPVGQHGP